MKQQDHSPSQVITLDPDDTPRGAMERVFLAEVHSPDFAADYNAASALEAMRNIRQAIENRLKDPARYEARGATNEIDIIKAPGQVKDFGNYPNLPPGKEQDIQSILTAANNPHDPKQAAYAQFVKNAIIAATESITHPVAGYPDATAWVTDKTQSPGSDFYRLGTVGGNTFYGTLPNPPHGAKLRQHAENLEHMTPVEQLRHYAAQARGAAAKREVPEHMKLYHMLMSWPKPMPSIAPVRGRQGAVRQPPGVHQAAVHLTERELARASLARRFEALLGAPAAAGETVTNAAGSGESLGGGEVAARQTGYEAWADGPIERKAWAFGDIGLGGRGSAFRSTLSVAPRGRLGPGRFGFPRAASRAGVEEVATLQPVQMHPPGRPAARGRDIAASASEVLQAGFAEAAARERSVSVALREYFLREARLPPRGGAGFDPRLTPVWPGVKGA